jgi:PAS domain S-box-containing protein
MAMDIKAQAELILDTIPDFISIQDTSYRILYQNKACKDIIGDHAGEYCYKAYEMSDIACGGCPLTTVFQEEGTCVTERSVLVDSKLMHIEVKASPLKDQSGKLIAGIEIIRDITERKNAEQSLYESKEFIENLIESMSDGLCVMNSDCVRIRVNKSLCDMTGFSKEELTGTAPPLPFWPPEHMNEIQKAFDNMKNGLLKNTELTLMRKNGERFPAIISPSYMKSKNDEITNFITTIRDISERKQTEKILKNMKDELEIKVKERTQELESIIQLLHNTLYERKKAEELIKIHEQQLCTLMSKLAIVEEQERKRIAEYIHDNISQNLASSTINLDKLQGSLPNVPNGLKEARELIMQAINFTRSLTFELSPPILHLLGFNDCVQWLIEKFRERYGANIELKTYGSVKELKKETIVLLFRTIRELLNNIIKHAKASRTTIAIHSHEDNIEINVEDDGIGFDTSEIDTYLIKGERFGLLSIRERIRYLNGVFEIESKPHEGTKVKIIVPLNQQE